jgi:hypothetical protein
MSGGTHWGGGGCVITVRLATFSGRT